MNSKRFIVLEAQDQANNILDFVEWLSLSRPDLGLKALTRREASNIVYFLVRDIVDVLLAHKIYNPENSEYIASILFGIPKNKLTQPQTALYEAVTAEHMWVSIIATLRNQVSHTIKQGDWTDWNVVKAGSLVGLAEGEDHRITEFHKEAKALAVDEEAVLTLNCKNPINYLYNEFSKRYGSNFHNLRHMLVDPDVKLDGYYRKILEGFVADPTEYIVGLFIDTLILMHPQIELSKNAPSRNNFIERALGIYDMSSFQSKVVQKLIMAFGMNWFNYEIKKDENYFVEYYLNTHIMAIFQKPFSTITEKYEAELLNALIRGDYLPPHEREIAERLYLESSQHVLNLNT